ncbi:hypothetical protein M409DRAFT_67354 [Zasmidium cellare ATCC 36951]|uniref:Cytoskeletal adapter protein sagA n=1 Tax=Zasmidium cellare ATCC 36951 TaxID=1080233 RepID=A0A6A6CEB6_ZASCE|nr:uncharacterized protein M409DRAFT_67354 [Zasmidium cellare ATCC 36951]KAF2165043.1 hypothetical protein M409DRAFT_67354 [Zasmidium cellare ATCC 36951]
MSDNGNKHAILNLSPDEKRAFSFLFNQADKDQLGVVTGENAVSFFERTHVSPNVLGEIWQLADTENRGFLSQPGFCMVLRLIGHYQAGREPTSELAFKSAPVPKFEGLQIPGVGAGAGAASGTGSAGGSAIPSPTTGSFPPNPLQPQLSGQAPIRVPPLDPQKVQQYSSLFERSGSQNGQLDGATAKAIFERAGLPNDVLGRIWNLADRDQKGALDQTEFIVAMHLLTSMKTRAMSALPQTLPPGFYEAAARRGAPPSRQASGQVPVPRQTTGGAVGAIPRTQSPLARPAGYGTPPPMSAQTSGTPWLITAADKAKFDQFFNTIDTQGRGVITGEQAVTFFSDSRLSEETLAQIWDLADINSEGQLNKDEFAVAMYLIRQQRASNAAPLPAFLPPPLVPPSMRKQQPQPQQSTAPAFDNAANTSNLPKSAADDLFGLDQPSQSQAPALQPQGTGASAAKDPFSGGSPASPSSPARFQPQPQQAGSMFKPFQPTSAFGASIAQQNTGTSVGSNQPRSVPQQAAPTAADDLLGDNETHAAESSKLTNETTELANMSNQIGNLRTQMEQTQAKKSTNQADLTATNNQKRDLELRLQQFRTQYEQEVKTVKELDQQLVESRESTKKLGQELAMLEGTYQDLQTQHQNVSQALQADQQENASLKQRIAQINTEVASLKPEIEKLKMDARQQKGLVSINKKQLATNEGEKEKLQSEKADLEREAAEREAQARAAPAPEPVVSPPAAASTVASPGGTLHSSNPFFRKASNDGARGSPPPTGTGSGPKPSAFDALFGPSAAFAPTGQASSRTGTPPATSFIGRSVPAAAAGAAVGAATAVGMSDSIQSVSSVGEPTPSATPPLSEQAKESPQAAEPPPPPESRQFTASHLPVGNVDGSREEDASSTRVLPPASRAGLETPQDTISSAGDTATPPQVHGQFLEDPKPETAAQEGMPGAFPSETFQSTNATPVPTHLETAPAVKDDFDSAFAGFGEGDKAKDAAKENEDPFGASSSQAAPQVSASEFPPIQTLEPEDDESDSEDEGKGFDDNFTAASPPRNQTATSSVQPPTEPPQYTSALAGASSSPPSYDDSDKAAYGGSGERIEENKFDPKFGGLLPAREDPTISAQPKNAFDDFDAFDDLAEAKEADKTGDFDFGEHNTEFNPTFDSPAASMTNTMTSTQQTPVAASRSLNQPESNGFANFQPSLSTSNTFGSTSSVANSSIQQTPENVQHDWDAIFSGLDNSKNVDTTLTTDPWGPSDATNTNGTSSLSAPAAPAPSSTTRPPTIENFPHPPPPAPASKAERGGAITPGTEHDDPILKRLTGMGYPRKDALDALEKYDYDINKVSLV